MPEDIKPVRVPATDADGNWGMQRVAKGHMQDAPERNHGHGAFR